jgi:UDP-GlcNAc:undecaprenyl-phosphate GlcNAc-1-phosphate transferase
VGLLSPDNMAPLVVAITCGLCVGFLPHNFHPARIIMGDAGALFIGLLLAVSTLEVGGRTGDDFSGQTFFFFAPIAIPFVILGVPLLDTAFAVVRRVSRRTGWSVADKEHLHHRLMRLGHGHRRAVVILWMWTGVLASLVLLPLKVSSTNALVLPGVLALAVLLFTVFRPEMRRSAVVAAAEAEDAVVAATRAADTVDVAESVLGSPVAAPVSDHRNGHRSRRHALRRRREAEGVAEP